MILSLENIENELNNIKDILYTEGKEKFDKSIFILDSYIEFINNLKEEYNDIEENSDEEYLINKILNEIEIFIKEIKKELGY